MSDWHQVYQYIRCSKAYKMIPTHFYPVRLFALGDSANSQIPYIQLSCRVRHFHLFSKNERIEQDNKIQQICVKIPICDHFYSSIYPIRLYPISLSVLHHLHTFSVVSVLDEISACPNFTSHAWGHHFSAKVKFFTQRSSKDLTTSCTLSSLQRSLWTNLHHFTTIQIPTYMFFIRPMLIFSLLFD